VVVLTTGAAAASYSQSTTLPSSSSDVQFPKLVVFSQNSEKPLKRRGIQTEQNTILSSDYVFPSSEKDRAVKTYPTIPHNAWFTIKTEGQQGSGGNNIDIESVAITPILSQDENGQPISLGDKITLSPILVDRSGTLGYSLFNQGVGDYVLNVYVRPNSLPTQTQQQAMGGYETRLQILSSEADSETTTETTTINERVIGREPPASNNKSEL
jgi:hypothetical protein